MRLATRQITLASNSGMVAGRSVLSAPKNPRTNDAANSAPAQMLNNLEKVCMAA
jgi:hypothetical protein